MIKWQLTPPSCLYERTGNLPPTLNDAAAIKTSSSTDLGTTTADG